MNATAAVINYSYRNSKSNRMCHDVRFILWLVVGGCVGCRHKYICAEESRCNRRPCQELQNQLHHADTTVPGLRCRAQLQQPSQPPPPLLMPIDVAAGSVRHVPALRTRGRVQLPDTAYAISSRNVVTRWRYRRMSASRWMDHRRRQRRTFVAKHRTKSRVWSGVCCEATWQFVA